MTQHTWFIVAIVIYMLVMLAIGYWSYRQTDEYDDYMLAGRGLNPFVLWKRRKLSVAQGQGTPAGLRPTADRVRETLFNWLGQDLSGWRCVDVCAGTGALGFEAASRGAAHVALVEQHPVILQHLHAACQTLGAQTVHIIVGDGLQYLRQQAVQAPRSVDVIFFEASYPRQECNCGSRS